MNTLDWVKLEKFIEERDPVEVSAGLLEDWFWTGATVYENGVWQDRDRPYVTSYWATPGFKATLKNGDNVEVVASRLQTEDEKKADDKKRQKLCKDMAKMAEAIAAEKNEK